MSLIKLIEFEEGYREKPYLCSNGYPTVGIGWKLGDKCSSYELERYYGKINFPYSVARTMCVSELEDINAQLRRHDVIGPVFNKLSNIRQDVLSSMAYQMGIGGLVCFKKMLKALSNGDYVKAMKEGLDSKWAKKDSPARAKRHMTQLESNIENNNYK